MHEKVDAGDSASADTASTTTSVASSSRRGFIRSQGGQAGHTPPPGGEPSAGSLNNVGVPRLSQAGAPRCVGRGRVQATRPVIRGGDTASATRGAVALGWWREEFPGRGSHRIDVDPCAAGRGAARPRPRQPPGTPTALTPARCAPSPRVPLRSCVIEMSPLLEAHSGGHHPAVTARVAGKCRSIWMDEGSPLMHYTREQARLPWRAPAGRARRGRDALRTASIGSVLDRLRAGVCAA